MVYCSSAALTVEKGQGGVLCLRHDHFYHFFHQVSLMAVFHIREVCEILHHLPCNYIHRYLFIINDKQTYIYIQISSSVFLKIR